MVYVLEDCPESISLMPALIPQPRNLPCGQCDVPAGQFVPTVDGNFAFNFQTRHNGDWHRQGVTLRQMLTRAMLIDPEATGKLVTEICCVKV